jgi:hypothetical protein
LGTFENMVGELKIIIYAHTSHQEKKMSLLERLFNHLIGYMQILFLKFVVTILGLNYCPFLKRDGIYSCIVLGFR